MSEINFLTVAEREARLLLAVAESDWERPVRQCPGWNAHDLVRHVGNVFVWMGAITTARERVAQRTLAPAPERAGDLPAWYLDQLARTLVLFNEADPQSITWTFSGSGDQRVAWWYRRLAVEVSIHRWDAHDAASPMGAPVPLDSDVATAGIDEYVQDFLPSLLSSNTIEGLRGQLKLSALDGPATWSINLSTDPSDEPTSIRATYSDLLLWLVNRGRGDTVSFTGRASVLDEWSKLRR